MNTTFKPSTEKLIRYALASLLLLIAINAFGGGVYGMSGAEDISVEWLKDGPFSSYFIPSLILFLCVGGSSLFAGITVFKRYQMARKAAFICGMIMIGWITAQVIIIGYVSWLQPAILVAAIVILILTWLLPTYEH